MIKSLSPYYLNIEWNPYSTSAIPEKYDLKLYIWNGVKSSPGSPIVTLQNVNPFARTDTAKVDISRYVRGFISSNFIKDTVTSINDGKGLTWVKTEVIYYLNGVAQPPENVNTYLASKGYGYGLEGENTQSPTNNVLSTEIEQKISVNSKYLFSFLGSETVSTVIVVKSENVTKTFTKTASTNSNDLLQTINIVASDFSGDQYIEILKDNVLINTLLITEEPRYTPIDVVFLNKEGALQTLTFFKEKVETLKIESENYESSNGQALDGVHQFKTYNVNGKTSFNVNSGFVKEDNNEIFKQLSLSDLIWQLKGNVYIPLNIDSKSLEYKSRQKDRLLNYKFDFSYSFSEKNSI